MTTFKLPTFVPKTPEQIEHDRRQRTVVQLQLAQAQRPDMKLFAAVSLAGWCEQAQAAGIATVPAEVVCRMPVGVILRFEEPAEGDQVHWKALSEARARLREGEMLRWDCCASLDLKSVMAKGGQKVHREYLAQPDSLNPAIPVWRSLQSVDDPRFIDITFEYPGDEIAVLKRPWIEARREGSHPVEYRVFVENGEVKGVANYYLQRGLDLDDCVRGEVTQAIAHTRTLLQHMQAAQTLPFNLHADRQRNGFDPDSISCTIDFLVNTEGDVLFLEAGPPFGLGAHPCAFVANEHDVAGRKVIQVEGVCLAEGAAPLPLTDFEPATPARSHGLGK